jgi:hypothetical protein
MPKNARDVAAGLRKKGFVERANRHKRYVLWVKEKKTAIFTEISHGEKEIGDPLLGVMARQLKISRSQFLDLIDCPLSREEYAEHLRKAGHIA